MMPRGGDVMFAMEEAMAMDAPAVMSGVSSKAGNKGDGLTAVTRVRSFFPETWVWVDVDTDAGTGLATLPDLVAPDSMTTWQFAAFSTHPTDGLAVADESAASSQLKVFKPFFTTKHQGTGLGLAICQRIVQGVGGRIEVRTTEGKGSTFSVVLPEIGRAHV